MLLSDQKYMLLPSQMCFFKEKNFTSSKNNTRHPVIYTPEI